MDVHKLVADLLAPVFEYQMARGYLASTGALYDPETRELTPRERSAFTRLYRAENAITDTVNTHSDHVTVSVRRDLWPDHVTTEPDPDWVPCRCQVAFRWGANAFRDYALPDDHRLRRSPNGSVRVLEHRSWRVAKEWAREREAENDDTTQTANRVRRVADVLAQENEYPWTTKASQLLDRLAQCWSDLPEYVQWGTLAVVAAYEEGIGGKKTDDAGT